MIRLLRFIITGSWHKHKWETVDKNKVTMWFDENKRPIRYETTYIQKCSVCGKLKSFKVKKQGTVGAE